MSIKQINIKLTEGWLSLVADKTTFLFEVLLACSFGVIEIFPTVFAMLSTLSDVLFSGCFLGCIKL